MAKRFFEEQTEESRVKAEIVNKYFYAWTKVVGSYKNKIAYIDLFAGPGRYKNGAASVPLMVLQQAIRDDFLAQRLVTVFNDKDENLSRTLFSEVQKLPDIKRLKYTPQIYTGEIGDQIVKVFEGVRHTLTHNSG